MFFVKNVWSGLLVESDRRGAARMFHSRFDATAWIAAQRRPDDFTVVEVTP